MTSKVIISTTIDPVIRQICKDRGLKISYVLDRAIRENIPDFQQLYDQTLKSMKEKKNDNSAS